MENKLKKYLIILLVIVLIIGAYFLGKNNKEDNSEILDRQTYLQELNRSTLEKLDVQGDCIYVIGHKVADSDTVICAIAYANLLNELGYNAKAMISGELNRETIYVLNSANVKTPEVLYDASGLDIFLVDHSEYNQAVDGMEDAHIVGIIDHHGIGSVITGQQVAYEARPIGAAATIIWLDYLNYGIDIDSETAYLLLCAVLSDTTNLTGTSVTNTDKEAVKELAKIAEVEDTYALYKTIYAERLSYEGMSNEEIFFSDYKEYEAYGTTFGIGLVSGIDEDALKELSLKMKEVAPEVVKKVGVDYLFASVGMREGDIKIDYIIPCDEKSETIFKNAFPNYDEYDGTAYIFRKGLGRKSKFVPGFTDYLGSSPHE